MGRPYLSFLSAIILSVFSSFPVLSSETDKQNIACSNNILECTERQICKRQPFITDGKCEWVSGGYAVKFVDEAKTWIIL